MTAMDRADLLRALRRLAKPDGFRCLGCGYEHNCSTHGCAVIWEAIRDIQTLALKSMPPKDPMLPAGKEVTPLERS